MKVGHWKLRDWVTAVWTATLICLALLTIYPGMGVTWSWASRNASNIASWVQAIGSILAIWGAFRIANLQQALQLTRQLEEDRLSKRKKYLLLHDRFVSCAALASSQTKSRGFGFRNWKLYAMGTDATLHLLNQLTIEDMPDIEMLTDVSNLRIRLEGLSYRFHDCLDRNDDERTPFMKIDTSIRELEIFAKASASTCYQRISEISSADELNKLNQHIKALTAISASNIAARAANASPAPPTV